VTFPSEFSAICRMYQHSASRTTATCDFVRTRTRSQLSEV